MRYTRLFLILTILFFSVTAATAEPADYALEVQDFTSLKVTDGINVEYHCSADSAGWVYFTCEPTLSQSLLFTNNKSQLLIQLDLDPGARHDLPTLHVYSSSLAKVENAADSTITVNNNIPVQQFKVKLIGNGNIIVHGIEAGAVDASISTGNGHIVLTGTAGRAKLSSVGTGPIEAGQLSTRNTKVILLGTGNIDCNATESLSIYGAGSGKVYYVGNPEKITNRSLGVKAFPMDSND